ncbi:hypothetical protein L1887_57252 [Cichorium endivia]|nr:hypothetical protein L1887_57252 [Cichorium endivia]
MVLVDLELFLGGGALGVGVQVGPGVGMDGVLGERVGGGLFASGGVVAHCRPACVVAAGVSRVGGCGLAGRCGGSTDGAILARDRRGECGLRTCCGRGGGIGPVGQHGRRCAGWMKVPVPRSESTRYALTGSAG